MHLYTELGDCAFRSRTRSLNHPKQRMHAMKTLRLMQHADGCSHSYTCTLSLLRNRVESNCVLQWCMHVNTCIHVVYVYSTWIPTDTICASASAVLSSARRVTGDGG